MAPEKRIKLGGEGESFFRDSGSKDVRLTPQSESHYCLLWQFQCMTGSEQTAKFIDRGFFITGISNQCNQAKPWERSKLSTWIMLGFGYKKTPFRMPEHPLQGAWADKMRAVERMTCRERLKWMQAGSLVQGVQYDADRGCWLEKVLGRKNSPWNRPWTPSRTHLPDSLHLYLYLSEDRKLSQRSLVLPLASTVLPDWLPPIIIQGSELDY